MEEAASDSTLYVTQTLSEEGKIPNVLETAIMDMGRQRGDKTFCPSEIARWMYPEDWRAFMPDVQEEMMRLYQEGKIVVTQKGNEVDKNQMPAGPVRIWVPKS
ncbi:DUF3253 domain-containing protein [Litoribacter ruber]|uniref:DUF3253 domain-containing protein n=1 Tax=Litoribacter ruber TaxID=702568 RepID=A0AAP2CIR7_9BACT|nr:MULTISPECIES: DUF3253 domain-containing protein [Litoribacter]MBS9524620.1 DUF3253 domain-containing protein [Litoribacter alkaliphilus]MBT0810222.1 DUF3253 domain-containing protein [Litoribacter ruber]